MKMTKKQVREMRAAWRLALVEGRVVRLPDGSLKECASIRDAETLISDLRRYGLLCERLQVPLEDQN
jgi:hypothetical protein